VVIARCAGPMVISIRCGMLMLSPSPPIVFEFFCVDADVASTATLSPFTALSAHAAATAVAV